MLCLNRKGFCAESNWIDWIEAMGRVDLAQPHTQEKLNNVVMWTGLVDGGLS